MARLTVLALCVVGALAVTCASAHAVSSHAMSSSLLSVSFVGRIDNLEGPTNIHFDWSGVELDVAFTVSASSVSASSGSVSLVLTDEGNLFNVFLDASATPTSVVQTANTNRSASYVLASGLAPGSTHTLKVTKRTEPLVGVTIFHGLSFGTAAGAGPDAVVTETEFVGAAECWALHEQTQRKARERAAAADADAVAAAPRQLEFYGDSITCGYGNEGVPPCPFTPQTENNYLAWGAVTARALHAAVHTEAWSGKGVVRNYGWPNTTSPDPMPSYFNQSVANTRLSHWNFARFVPHAFVVNLGTNDYSTQPIPPDDVFVAGYHALLDDVESAYAPQPPALVLVCGPMATVPQHCANVQRVATERSATFVDLNGVLTAPTDYGCAGHPSVAGHAKMSAAMVPVLQKLLGW